jgi:replication factor A1
MTVPTMDALQLSRGAIKHVFTTNDTSNQPVVQVIELKQINASGSANPRYRLAVSDGVHFQQAMLATQLNEHVVQGLIAINAVIRMNDFIANEVANKRIIIILNVEVLGNPGERVGAPVSVDTLVGKQEPASNITGTATAPLAPQAVAAPQTGGFKGMSWGAPQASGGFKPSSSGVMALASGPSPTKSHYRPIQTINPYQSGWTIRGRCTYKSDVRKFQNARGEGSVVSFELTDDSGSIRITAFTELAADVEVKVHTGRVYIVSRGQLKQANERFNRSTSSFEMTLDRNSVLNEADDDGSVAQIHYNFTKIADLDSIDVKGNCDIVAAVHEISEVSEIIVRSTGEPMKKRSITLVDDSNASVELTLWRNQAETLLTEADLARHPIILLRNASRGDYGGVCLNTTRATVIEIDPTNVPEANSLRGWYDAGGATGSQFQSLSGGMAAAGGGRILGDRKSLEQARVEDVAEGVASGSAYFVMRGYVTFMKKDKDLSYPSDPETKKKVTSTAPGLWHSESTGRDYTDDEIIHRYICNMKVADFSGSEWMSAFDESGVVIIGRTAGEMRDLRSNDPNLFDSIVDDCYFRPYVMKVQVREQEYQGERKIRYSISRCENVDFISESRAILSEIASYGIAA